MGFARHRPGTVMKLAGKDCSLPRITIITPCRNGARYITEAIDSVIAQRYPNLEHIVVDAASSDATLSLISRYPAVTVISEPDDGSHDAMNKGVARATGDVIGFLNVDDVYPDNTLLKVGRIFAATPDIDIVMGNAIVFEDDGCGARAIRFVYAHPLGVWLEESAFGNPGINGWFFRRSTFDRIGLFDNAFFICADRDFVVRVALAGMSAVVLHEPTIWYRAHREARTTSRDMANVMPISEELFRMASNLVGAAGGTPRVRRVALAWRAFESAKLIWLQCRRGRLREALRLLIGCSLRQPLWPVRLTHALILRRLVRRNYSGGWNMNISLSKPYRPLG